MPLADDCGGVAGSFENGGDGFGSRLDESRRVRRSDAGTRLAKGVLAGEEGKARRRTGGGRTVAAREAQSGGGEAVDIRRCDFRGAVATDVAVAQIVRHDDDYVGWIVGRDSRRQQSERNERSP